MAVCDSWSKSILNKPLILSNNRIVDEAQHGLQVAHWPGRAQTLELSQEYGEETWLLDGAHTCESMEVNSNNNMNCILLLVNLLLLLLYHIRYAFNGIVINV
jgi:hypothetical protein